MQASLMAYSMGIGVYVAFEIASRIMPEPERETALRQAFSQFGMLYAIAGFMGLAIVFAVVAPIFSRSTLYLLILYVPTAVYAYYALSA